MARKSHPQCWITSRDKLADWIFSRVIFALNYEVENIYVKHILRERFRGSQIDLYGFVEDNVIYLSNAKTKHRNREAIAKTLLHEALHVVFEKIPERNILRLEDLVWEKLSREQIRILKSYIPRHTVKSRPD